MKTIKKDELYRNLGEFLQSKGIELKDGTYAQRIRQGCDLLSGAINATQSTVTRAQAEVDRKLQQLRRTVHEATKPEPEPSPRRTSKAAKPGPGSKRAQGPKPAPKARAKTQRRR